MLQLGIRELQHADLALLIVQPELSVLDLALVLLLLVLDHVQLLEVVLVDLYDLPQSVLPVSLYLL